MTNAEFAILVALRRYGPLTASELRDDFNALWGTTRTWQGYAAKLRSLERRQFVERHDPVAHIWRLSAKGHSYVAR